jgi:two-component system probable response regulator PhcQ
MLRIMIVDDEENILAALRRTLRRQYALEIETYVSAKEALKRARAASFELFLSDYRMPQMDGVTFLSQVRLLQPDAIRIMLSGFADREALVDAINNAQVYRFIFKPVTDYELIATIKEALMHRRELVENKRLAAQVKHQQEQDRRQAALAKFAEQHPVIASVDWAPDGSIILDEDET